MSYLHLTGSRARPYPALMPKRPNPDGWKGGSEDFTYLRTFDGRRVVSPASTEDESKKVLDGDWSANAQSLNDIFDTENN